MPNSFCRLRTFSVVKPGYIYQSIAYGNGVFPGTQLSVSIQVTFIRMTGFSFNFNSRTLSYNVAMKSPGIESVGKQLVIEEQLTGREAISTEKAMVTQIDLAYRLAPKRDKTTDLQRRRG